MLSRVSSEFLIKSVLGALAALVVVILGTWVWGTAEEYRDSAQALKVVELSRVSFKVLANNRPDRSATERTWITAEQLAPDVRAYVSGSRDAEMPALRATIDLLATIPLADRDSLLAELKRAEAAITALQTEYWAGMAMPKAQRRAGLADAYVAEGLALQKTLEQVSANLFAGFQARDSFIMQMIQIKQLGWLARNVAGEASLLITKALATGHLSPEARQLYGSYVGGTETAWHAIDGALIGIPLSPGFRKQLREAREQFFAPDYLAIRARILEALVNGTKPELSADQWQPFSVQRMGATQTLAESALAEARDQAATDLDRAANSAGVPSSLAARLPGIVGVRRGHDRPARHRPVAHLARRDAEAGRRRRFGAGAVHRPQRRDRRPRRRLQRVSRAGGREAADRAEPACRPVPRAGAADGGRGPYP